MPLYKKLAAIPSAPDPDKARPLSLDERLFVQLQPRTPLDNLEAQEFRQAVMKALQKLNPAELKVMELRYQHKKSPGQAALQLGLTPKLLKSRERSALKKLRKYLASFGGEA